MPGFSDRSLLSRSGRTAFSAFAPDGLMLGHGTVLARWARNRPGQPFAEDDGERVVVLVSAAQGRPVSPQVMKHVARAATRWIDPSALTFTALQVAANGPLKPDGTAIVPMPQVDPLDPKGLNDVPSVLEQ